MGKDVFGDGRETIVRVAPDGQPLTIEELRRDLVRDLMGILRPVHDHNVERSDDWREQTREQLERKQGMLIERGCPSLRRLRRPRS